MKKEILKYILIPLICTIIIYTLVFPFEIAYLTRKALDLCYSAVVPSLFIFIVLSKILSHFSKSNCKHRRFWQITGKVLNISPVLLPTCMLGLFCGAPAMSYSIKNIYNEGLCTKEDAQRAVVLSNNCSFSFILGFASSTFTDRKTSLIILFSNLFAVFTVYFLLFRGKRNDTYTHIPNCIHKEKKLSKVITESISESAISTVTLCGYIVFFYVISFVAKRHLISFLSSEGLSTNTYNGISALMCSFFEMTSGTVSAFSVEGYGKIPILCFCTTLLGTSVFCQVASVFSECGIPVTPFIKAKILSAFLSSATSVIILLFIPADIPAASNFGGNRMNGFTVYHLACIISVTVLCFIGASILSYIDKRHKN